MRTVTIVLDEPRVVLPAFSIASPWWMDVEPVVAAVQERFGLGIVVLRVVAGEVPHESPITYLAELVSGDPTPWSKLTPFAREDHPARLSYARPGGPAADLAWAAAHLQISGPPIQVRTWNLSSIWRLPTGVQARFDALAACGLPDTLVHGDFHPGNVRLTSTGPILLDWGDCGVGHPLLDLPAFLDRSQDLAAARAHWLDRWAERLPGSDPRRAARLIGPIGALRQAVVYRSFLDAIEPSEHVYHRHDPATWLTRAADLA